MTSAAAKTITISRAQAAARVEHLAKVAPRDTAVQGAVAGVLKAAQWRDLWDTYAQQVVLTPEACDRIWSNAYSHGVETLIAISDKRGFSAAAAVDADEPEPLHGAAPASSAPVVGTLLSGSKIPDAAIDQANAEIVAVVESYGVKLEKRGKDLFALCPFHTEQTPSFTITPAKGKYHCFGCGAGGDAISFVRQFTGCGFREAVERINGALPPGGARVAKTAPAQEVVEEWMPMVPVPDKAPLPMDIINRKIDGRWVSIKASTRWDYLNTDGDLIGYVFRFDVPGVGKEAKPRKEVLPQSYCVNNDTGEVAWRWKAFSEPRPLYGLDHLAANPEAQVVIVEGEKACDAARAVFAAAKVPVSKLVVISWPGGGKAVRKVDWSPLYGRKVGLWPDADQQPYKEGHRKAGKPMPFIEQPGTVAMLDVFEQLREHCPVVKFFLPRPAGIPDGWDVADELPADFDVLKHIKTHGMNAADVRKRFSLTTSVDHAESVLPVWLVPPTSPVDLQRASFAADVLALFDEQVAQRLDPRGVVLRTYDGINGLRAALEEISRFMPSAKVHAIVSPELAAEAAKMGGFSTEVLPSGESWADNLWAAVTDRTGLQAPAMPDPAVGELAEQAAGVEGVNDAQGHAAVGVQEVGEPQAYGDAPEQPEVAAREDMDPQLRVNAAPVLSLDPSLMQVGGGHVAHDRETRAEVGGLGIIPLGTLGRSYMFWRKDTQTVELIGDNAVGSEASIMRLAPRQSWEMWCVGNAAAGKRDAFNKAAITNMLIQVSKGIGRASTGFVPPDVAPPEKVQRAFVEALLCAQPSAGLVAQALFVHPWWKKAEVWYDGFRGEVMVTNVPPCGGPAGVWDESHDSLLSSWVSMQWGVTCSATMSAEAVIALARQDDRHPVRDYLNGLVWDGKPRLDTWLVDLAGADDNAYTRAVGAKTLVAAVARVMKPGCKHDTMLVLEGPQGLRKSSLIEALLPNLAWHTDSLGEKVGHKDARAGLQGKWVIEVGELANLHGAQVEAVKQFLSDASDHYRPSYGRRAKDFPRQCVFIGTINPQGDGAYLHDATGGRRFWPVECTMADVERMRAERDQLWAEAVQRYKDGFIWWLSKEEDALASQEQGARQEENPWVPRVARYIDFTPPADKIAPWGGRRVDVLKFILTSDVFEAFVGRAYLGSDLKDGKKIADALRVLGWESKNQPIVKGGRNIRHWRRVKAAEDEGPL